MGTFELYEDDGGLFRWRLRDDEGDVIAQGDPSTSRIEAQGVIDLVRRTAPDSPVADLT